MIEVEKLVKKYGDFLAVDHVNFSIKQGEIVGFLGPNGAGKTTTFRILANYFAPSAGRVSLMGLDASKDSLQVRGKVGYLPENNPLWLSMEVTEYLAFIWRSRKLGNKTEMEKRIREVTASCGLGQAVGSDIAELSKGYRQRVGLAAALLHDPDVLLLDEPTSGLDPIQAREVRELIKSFKGKKTILLSTHILSEVQSVCDRVLIIHKGRLVADRKTTDLTNSGKEYVIWLHVERELIERLEDIGELEGVQEVEGPVKIRKGEFAYKIRTLSDIRSEIFQFASRRLLPVLELRMEQRSLEDVFHELTQ